MELTAPRWPLVLSVFMLDLLTGPGSHAGEIDWPANGRDVQGSRYLPASQITRGNVRDLEPAWTYRTGETRPEFRTKKPASFQATPIVFDGVMFLGTRLGRVIALDPATSCSGVICHRAPGPPR